MICLSKKLNQQPALRAFVACVIAVLVASFGFAQSKPRNVLLLISDDHGREMLGAYGNRIIKTPNLDKLASEGVRFTNAFSTVASCSPSRAVLYTGMYQHANGQYGLSHSVHNQHSFDDTPTVGKLLANANYRTAIIGKHHVKPLEMYGFQQVIPGAKSERDVKQIADAARNLFAEKSDKPFFIVVGYSDPHRTGNPDSRKRGEPSSFANETNYDGVTPVKYNPREVIVPAYLPDQQEVREELAEYYQAISRLDAGIGMMLDNLRLTNQLDNTLVIYLSDNGIPFPGAKTNLYDSGLHLPLIIRAPNQVKRGTVNNALVSWTDITPTILDFAGIEKDKRMSGRSFLSILEQQNPNGWDEVFGSHSLHEITMYYPMRSIRTGEYQLIWNLAHRLPFPHANDLWNSPTWQAIIRRQDKQMGVRQVANYTQRPEWELYDIRRDPEEARNLADDERYKTTLETLKQRLRNQMVATKDQWMQTLEQ